MRTQAKTVQTANPTVDITINKSRIKRYNKDSKVPTFYMNDGQEFQLELFNPTTDVIATEIILNNKRFERGLLVLKPGQRVFLDRYLDSPRKFKFETYEVGKSKSVEQAIQYNGVVDVRFYKEIQTLDLSGSWTNPTYTYYGNSNFTIPLNDWNITNTTSNDTTLSTNTTSNTFTTAGMFNASVSSFMEEGESTHDRLKQKLENNRKGIYQQPVLRKMQETGTVGKGSVSDQKFQDVDYEFSHSDFHRVQYQILPISQKMVTTDDLNVRRYCVQCGAKQKPNFKFCPNCGQRV